MTTKERFQRMYDHREADRIPMIDSPWAGTIRRWQSEGMPKDVAWEDYFGADKTAGIGVDITPRYEEKVLEETYLPSHSRQYREAYHPAYRVLHQDFRKLKLPR